MAYAMKRSSASTLRRATARKPLSMESSSISRRSWAGDFLMDNQMSMEWTIMKESASAPEAGVDWTARDGRANASEEFVALGRFVGEILRDQAVAMISGNTDQVGHLIMARLAHEKGLAPLASADRVGSLIAERLTQVIRSADPDAPGFAGDGRALMRSVLHAVIREACLAVLLGARDPAEDIATRVLDRIATPATWLEAIEALEATRAARS